MDRMIFQVAVGPQSKLYEHCIESVRQYCLSDLQYTLSGRQYCLSDPQYNPSDRQYCLSDQ